MLIKECHIATARRPRLLYLAWFDPTNIANGTSARGRAMLDALLDHFDITVVCLEGQFRARPDAPIVERLAGRYVVPYSRAAYFGFSLALYREADRRIQRWRPDVILADLDKAGMYAALLGQKHKVPFVYSSHNVEYLRFLDLAASNRLRLLFVPWTWLCERVGVAAAAMTVAITEPDAAALKRMSRKSNVVALPMAFDEALFNPDVAAPRGDDMTVLTVGNFAYPPNRIAAIKLCEQVVPEVARSFPRVRFRFVGPAFPRDLTHPNVERAGFVDDLQAEYRRATVVLVPVESGGGLKIKAVEALACGCQLVATPKGMEGIDYDGMELVDVAPLEEFSARIMAALRRGPVTTRNNWSRVSESFGVRGQTAALVSLLNSAARLPQRAT